VGLLGGVGARQRFFVLIFSGLGHFVPVFGEGNTPAAVAASSLLLWTVHLLVLRGLRTAAIVNGLVTVAKLLPIAFLILAAGAFRMDVFRADFLGTPALGDLGQQLRGMMLVTVWVFIGIEASIYSRRARRADVGRATVIGFLGVWLLLVLVSLLSMGVLSQAGGRAAQSVDGLRAARHRRRMGRDGDHHRFDRLRARRIAGLGAAVRRSAVCRRR
jgi:amino acid transporter